MINDVHFIRPIPIEVPRTMILTRLGYRNSITRLSAAQREKLENTMAEGYSLCEAQGCWRRIPVVRRNEDEIVLRDGSVLKSSSLTALLKNSFAVVFMASTVGPGIVDAASEAIRRGDGASAAICDAVGAQSAEAAMNWMNRFIHRQLSRSAAQLTARRFSPGFGDFGLENQKVIYSLLDLDRLGLQLTSHYMLIPEKSVTAVAGIERSSLSGAAPGFSPVEKNV